MKTTKQRLRKFLATEFPDQMEQIESLCAKLPEEIENASELINEFLSRAPGMQYSVRNYTKRKVRPGIG